MAKSGGKPALPWRVEIDPFVGTSANTNWSTLTVDVAQLYNGVRQSSGAQNAEISFDIMLGAGTWDLSLLIKKGSDAGIYTITLDGASLTSLGGSADTIDGYAAAASRNQNPKITGIVIPASGKKRLRLVMATKSVSNVTANFFAYLSHISLQRTA